MQRFARRHRDHLRQRAAGGGRRARTIAGVPNASPATFSLDGHTVAIWVLGRGEQLLELRDRQQSMRDPRFSPDGTMLASGSEDFSVREWETGEPDGAPGK